MTYAPPSPDPLLPPVRVNLYSDTQTKPSAAMKQAMMEAEVGDEQRGDDPTVTRSAIEWPRCWARRQPCSALRHDVQPDRHPEPLPAGDEVLAHERSHIITSEAGGAAALAGVMVTGLKGALGQFDAETVRAALRAKTRNAPAQTLVAVEQTANFGGGAVWPPERLQAVAETAHEHELATHMDGARLLNATVASGIEPSVMTAGMDSVWLDFTKGLGAPLGAVLCGSAGFIDLAWRWKQRLGGAMRQAGMCAAACLYALDHNVASLAEDHANAKALARGLGQIRASSCKTRKPTWCSSIRAGPVFPPRRSHAASGGKASRSLCPARTAPAPARISTLTALAWTWQLR